jgi:putative hydrolase of the HAD superfamily
MPPALSHVDCWIFDLDLTLYTPEHGIMGQVRDRIATYVERFFDIGSDEAHRIRHDYWQRYGTTLRGLMTEHGVDPHGYLEFVHDVDLSALEPCAALRSGIESLPGRKLIFTNADLPYAQRVLKARGLTGLFEDVFDIHRMEHRPKPSPPSYDALCRALEIDPQSALFVEDSAPNLEPAKAMGMTTIWIDHDFHDDPGGAPPSFVDVRTPGAIQWLEGLKESVHP